MTFISLLAGLIIIKAIFPWLLYSQAGIKVLWLGCISSLAWYPLLTVLYHETSLNLWMVFPLIMVCDVFIYHYLLKKNLAGSIIMSVLLNVMAIIFFLFENS